jgi:hypothetical protein
MDYHIEGQYSPREAMKVAQIVNKCLSDMPTCRPNMDEVVRLLELPSGFQGHSWWSGQPSVSTLNNQPYKWGPASSAVTAYSCRAIDFYFLDRMTARLHTFCHKWSVTIVQHEKRVVFKGRRYF